MVKVGQKVLIDPFNEITGFASEDNKGRKANGTVVMVNRAHKWFSVEYERSGVKLRASYKFYQIGSEVRVCG